VPVNDAPVARADSATVGQDGATAVNVRINDSDLENNALTVTSTSDPAHGTATINSDGTVTYAPDAGYSGADSFTYTITDNGTSNGTADPKSSTATVTMTVTSAVAEIRDVSAQVSVTRYAIRYNLSTKRYTQQIVLLNNGPSITTPIFLVLDNLSTNATLFNKSGNTTRLDQPPVGSPYRTGPSSLPAGASATINLEFTKTGTSAITYDTRVLTGNGTP
jgi:hypothetical protein